MCTSRGSLRDHPFQIYYGPADDPLANFYILALSASVRYDRSAVFSVPAHWPSQRRESHVKGKFVRPEVEALENMRLAFFDDLVAPAEDEPGAPAYVQMGLNEAQEDQDSDVEP